jgi:hypothetical protein
MSDFEKGGAIPHGPESLFPPRDHLVFRYDQHPDCANRHCAKHGERQRDDEDDSDVEKVSGHASRPPSGTNVGATTRGLLLRTQPAARPVAGLTAPKGVQPANCDRKTALFRQKATAASLLVALLVRSVPPHEQSDEKSNREANSSSCIRALFYRRAQKVIGLGGTFAHSL